MIPPSLQELLNHPALRKLAEHSKNTEFEGRIYLVGGAIRDALLGRPPKHDLDLVTELDALALAQLIHPHPQVYPRFGTAMVQIEGTNIELVTARKESYDSESRKPKVTPATLLDDALRRDFTVNTLLLNIHTGELIDPLGSALADLESRTLRTPVDPTATFHDDPLRMLRAVRFKFQLGFNYAKKPPLRESGEGVGGEVEQEQLTNEHAAQDLERAIHSESHRLSIISQERIRDELTKMLLGPSPHLALQDLLDLGLLHTWAPELIALVGVEQGQSHTADVWNHTLEVLQNVSEKPPLRASGEGAGGEVEQHQAKSTEEQTTLRLAALLHDIAKPRTRSIDHEGQARFINHEVIGAQLAHDLCLRWRYSQQTADQVHTLVRNHMRLTGLKTVSPSAARRIINQLGDQLNNWLILTQADSAAHHPNAPRPNFDELRITLSTLKATIKTPTFESPLSGAEIMNLASIEPGPQVGELKTRLQNLVLDGKIDPEDKESAKRALQELLRNRPKP